MSFHSVLTSLILNFYVPFLLTALTGIDLYNEKMNSEREKRVFIF
jgi:hypothetical protein